MSRKEIASAVLEEAAIMGLVVLVPGDTLLNGMRDVGLCWSILGGSRLVPFVRGCEVNNSDAWKMIVGSRPEFFDSDVALY
jgi:hypothetical protein